MCNKIKKIMRKNNWDTKADSLFLEVVKNLKSASGGLRKEYSVKDICIICDAINVEMKLKNSTLTYAKNILFSGVKGRDYFIFKDNFNVDEFTKEINSKNPKRVIESVYKDEIVYINPKYIEGVYAGKNEKKFIVDFEKKYGKSELKGKKVFNDGVDVTISVDNSIEYKGKTVLIEIDSGNMAKLLVGQYFLLNELIPDKEKLNYIFVVVHYYKDYNPNRTEKNLNLVKKNIGKDAMNFKVFTSKNFIEFYDKGDIKGLVNKLFAK